MSVAPLILAIVMFHRDHFIIVNCRNLKGTARQTIGEGLKCCLWLVKDDLQYKMVDFI